MSTPRLTRRHLRILAWSAASLVAGALLVGLILLDRDGGYAGAWDRRAPEEGVTDVLARAVDPEEATFRFEEITGTSGIDFRHFPDTRRNLLPEDMGSGLAWGDYDDDGYPDLFLANFQGSILGPSNPGRCALFRNNGDGTFTDVSEEAGLGCSCYALGAAWGDYDNNGRLDLYVTRYGPNLLYRNNGDGTFSDVTTASGAAGGDHFSTGAAWGDFDNDGHIDLYVANYVAFSYQPGDEERTGHQYGAVVPFTLNPSAYLPVPNYLFRNNGDGTFSEKAAEAGVANPTGRSLGAVWCDFNNNGLPDLYVANDISDNALFLNRGDGTFEDAGASSLAADYRGAMGLAVVDYEHDGTFDIFITNWLAQRNSFFKNMSARDGEFSDGNPNLVFLDVADFLGLGPPSLAKVGWATGFADFDNDGYPDLWVVNGHTFPGIDDPIRLQPQKMQLFRQRPDGDFIPVGPHAWEGTETPVVGRGGAHADFDLDGRMDLAVMVHGDRPILLRNVTESPGNWLILRLRQRGANTRALGALVRVRADGTNQSAQVGAAPSYLSQSPSDMHFGLGRAEEVEELEIRWPDGSIQVEHNLPVNRLVTFTHQPRYPARDYPRRGLSTADEADP